MRISTIPLARNNNPLGIHAETAGWGKEIFNVNAPMSNRLKNLTVYLTGHEVCLTLTRPIEIDFSQMCGRVDNGYKSFIVNTFINSNLLFLTQI